MTPNVIIRILDLPNCVKAVTIPNSDDTYNIYVNARYTEEKQREFIKHELSHIRNCDFNNFDDITTVEFRANNSDDYKCLKYFNAE